MNFTDYELLPAGLSDSNFGSMPNNAQKVVPNNPKSQKTVIWGIILRDFWCDILRGAPTRTSAVSAFCVDPRTRRLR
jgi:hypothetical protein